MIKKIFVIDASGYLYRAYHAIRQMTNAKGESTNALFGFVRSVLKLIKDFEPTHLVSVFDGPNNASKRLALDPEYKAHRKEMPQDLRYQIAWAQEFCQLIGIPELMISGVEADDTMGSLAVWAAKKGMQTYLCTSDKDMCQLVVDNSVFILNTFKENQILDEAAVKNQFGVTPKQMIDYLAITGDASDNIPGLSGFGPKTAAQLLEKFGSLDYILDHPNEIPGAKKQQTLIGERERVLLSRELVKIDLNVAFEEVPDDFSIQAADTKALKEFYTNMNFSSLLKELESASPVQKTEEMLVEELTDYQIVDDKQALEQLISRLLTEKEICIDTETTHIHPLRAKLVGVGVGVSAKQAWYIPTNGKLGLDVVLQSLKPLLENPEIGFYGHNLKYDYQVFLNYGIRIASICFDTILASYILNSHSRKHSLDHLTFELFNKIKIPIESLIGKGKTAISMNDVEIAKVCHYCCEDVDYTIRLKQRLSSQIEERGLSSLLYDLELPLLPILAMMERHGIYVDVDILKLLAKEVGDQIQQLADTIYAMAGEPFNINSPKQLSQILFQKMGIAPPKKIATGFSTNADVLENLKNQHPIAGALLDYRTLEKLRSTYIETLPLEINTATHRIHCNFNQSVTATGRLSCQDPNLQNIPVRTEMGRKIREAFRPQLSGWSYLSADYSQIELRLLAHLSNDPVLVQAFKSNEDIHQFTASQIFNIPLEKVTKEQRYQAKAVNFGIMYGQQAFGLSQELGIDTKTASLFIKMYFERYEKVKAFIDESKEKARLTGKAITLFGRERQIPEITSSNMMIRSMAERLAVNTPLQGTQADLIKMAMLRVDKELLSHGLRAYMILQIHDELLFEVPDEELAEVSQLVHHAMVDVVSLNVPLVVNIDIGKNWKEC